MRKWINCTKSILIGLRREKQSKTNTAENITEISRNEIRGGLMEKCCENCSHFPIQSLDDPRWQIICYEQCGTANFTDTCEKWESIDTAIDTWIKEHPDK